MGKPLGMFLLLKFFIQLSEDDCHIPDNAVIYDNIFIDLYRININLQNLCLFCKFLWISKYTVRKTNTNCDQKITFTDTEIGRLCSVHSKHSGIVF